MVNEERLGLMIRMAKQDTPEQRKALKIAKYYRNDYIALALIRKFIVMTIAYGLLAAICALAAMDFFMDNIQRINFRILGAEVIIGYIIFMGFYLGITYIVWSLRYRNARRTRKIYEENIRKIDKIYQREDRENR